MENFPKNKIFEVVDALEHFYRGESIFEIKVLDNDNDDLLTFYYPRFLDGYWRELFFREMSRR